MPTKDAYDPAILVVDDDDTLRKLLATILTAAGFGVLLAANGREAVALYRQHRRQVRLVLLDVEMPGQDGPATLADLRRLDADVQCCFLSGWPDRAIPRDIEQQGAVAFVQKPFQVPTLVDLVQRLVRGEATGGMIA